MFAHCPSPLMGTMADLNGEDGERDTGIGHHPEGELYVPLASQEIEYDRAELAQQALDAVGNSRE